MRVNLIMCLGSLSIGLLSACSSGGGVSTTEDAMAFAEGVVQNFFNRTDNVPTPDDAVPTAGSATYSGAFVIDSTIDVAPEDDLLPEDGLLFAIGSMDISADFASSSLSGVARNFIDGSDRELVGQLELTGEITSGSGIEVRAVGELDRPDGTYNYG